jgi:hypothetical protein
VKAFRLIIALCVTLACRPPALLAQTGTNSPESGVTKSGYYRNDYFGFSIPFPESWTVVLQRKPHQFQSQGGDALVRDGVLKRGLVNADQSNTHNLLAITDSREESNGWSPQIVIVGEGIHEGAPFKTADEYLVHTIKLLSAIRFPKTIVLTPPRETTLGARQFWRADFARGDVRQSYYATISKGFALSIVVTGGDAAQLSKANGVVQKIHFSSPK